MLSDSLLIFSVLYIKYIFYVIYCSIIAKDNLKFVEFRRIFLTYEILYNGNLQLRFRKPRVMLRKNVYHKKGGGGNL
jgi:hypothetical protein